MKKWFKTSFCFQRFIILTYLVSVVTPKDVCESCLPASQCPFFSSMGSKEQLSWIQKYPCSKHPDDYGIPPGSKYKGDSICCPNEVWGIDKQNQSSRLINSFGNNQGTPESYIYQIQPPYNLNNGIKNENIKSSDGYPNNQQWRNKNNSPLGPKRWPITETNTNWNERPDKTQRDTGNTNDDQGGNNWRNNVNNRPNNQGSQKSPYFYNWRNFMNDRTGNRYNDNPMPSQLDNSNNNRLGGNPNPMNNPFLPNSQRPGTMESALKQTAKNCHAKLRSLAHTIRFHTLECGKSIMDWICAILMRVKIRVELSPDYSRANAGQCDRLTRFPPNAQTGCCGQEASDDDRINDAPNLSNQFLRTYNDFRPQALEKPNLDWSYSMFKEEVKGTDGTTKSETTHIAYNNTLPSGNISSAVEIEYRIAGGKETELTQYPWTVLLMASFVSGNQTFSASCGGSLISARFILTAAHCLYDDKASLEKVKVFLAEYDKKTFPTDCKTTSRGQKCVENLVLYAANVHLSPGFEESRLQNDIALIELQSDVPYTEYIRPICLPSINVDDPEHARLTLTAAGWGRNGPYQTDIKQSTTIHLVPQYDCRRFYPDLTPRHLCAAGYTGEDTCKGDSGGPLMVKYRGKYFVVGVVSGKRTDVNCGSTVPSLYTNVYHYLNWIRETIAT